jgi:hypothetical protein
MRWRLEGAEIKLDIWFLGNIGQKNMHISQVIVDRKMQIEIHYLIDKLIGIKTLMLG